MSGSLWRSNNAPFDEDGYSMVLRDIEFLFLSMNQLKQAIGVDLGPIMSAEAFATKIATDNQMWEKTFKTAGLMQ